MKTRDLDRFRWRLHDPACRAILTALSACEQADARFLQRITHLAGGSLSSALAELEKAGLVESEKQRFEKNQARVRLSDDGRRMFEIYRVLEGEAPQERRPAVAAEDRAGAHPGTGAAEGRATRSGFTLYRGEREKPPYLAQRKDR